MKAGKLLETTGDTGWDKKGDNSETRLREGRHTVQHRHTCGETMGENGEPWGPMGDQGRQDPERAGTRSKKGKQEGRWETMEDDKGRQDLGKADTPSNSGIS